MLQSPSMGNDLEPLPLELLCPVIPAAPVPYLSACTPLGLLLCRALLPCTVSLSRLGSGFRLCVPLRSACLT